jgi:hypothetical protein
LARTREQTQSATTRREHVSRWRAAVRLRTVRWFNMLAGKKRKRECSRRQHKEHDLTDSVNADHRKHLIVA